MARVDAQEMASQCSPVRRYIVQQPLIAPDRWDGLLCVSRKSSHGTFPTMSGFMLLRDAQRSAGSVAGQQPNRGCLCAVSDFGRRQLTLRRRSQSPGVIVLLRTSYAFPLSK